MAYRAIIISLDVKLDLKNPFQWDRTEIYQVTSKTVFTGFINSFTTLTIIIHWWLFVCAMNVPKAAFISSKIFFSLNMLKHVSQSSVAEFSARSKSFH